MKTHNTDEGVEMNRFRALLLLVLTVSLGLWAAEGDKEVIAVYGFRSIGIPQTLAESLQEHLESNLLKYGAYEVLSRADINLVLRENAFQQSGACDDEACLIEAGHVLGLEKLITGTVSMVGQTYNTVLKVIDIETAKLESSVSRRHTGSVDGLLVVMERALDDLLKPEPPAPVVVRDTVVVVKHTTDTVTVRSAARVDTVTVTRRPEPRRTIEPAPEAKAHARTIGIGAVGILSGVALLVVLMQIL